MAAYPSFHGGFPSMQEISDQLARRSQSQRHPIRPQQSSGRPSRIEKPRSKQSSPHDLVRRKTYTSTHGGHSTSQQLPYIPTINTRDEVNMARLERPMSWHANSHQAYDYSSYYHQPSTTQTTPSSMYSRSSYEWPDDKREVVPTYPSQGMDGHFQSYFQCPSVGYNRNDSTYNVVSLSTQQSYWPSQDVGPSHPFSASQADINYHPQPQYNQPTSIPAYDANVKSWQQVETPELVEDVSPSCVTASGLEELVGLGLYDNSTPAESGMLGLTRGKSLKLAEGWAPAEDWVPPGQNKQKKQQEHDAHKNYQHDIPAEQKHLVDTNQSQHMYAANNIDDHSWMFDPNVLGQVWFGEVDSEGNPIYEY